MCRAAGHRIGHLCMVLSSIAAYSRVYFSLRTGYQNELVRFADFHDRSLSSMGHLLGWLREPETLLETLRGAWST